MLTPFTLITAQREHCYHHLHFVDMKTEEPVLSHVVASVGAGI